MKNDLKKQEAIYTDWEIVKVSQDISQSKHDLVVKEKPLTVFVDGVEIVTLICSPEAYIELGVGFLISEGFINSRNEIKALSCKQEEGLLDIGLYKPLSNTGGFLRRNIASCCGKGRTSLYFINDARQVRPLDSGEMFETKELTMYLDRMEIQAEVFKITGGVHCSALAKDSTFVMFEDIGRHNTVDKLIGYGVLNNIELADKCLILSGRISSEIVIKAARVQIPLLLSRSAPTELALTLADDLNISVIGFARQGSLNIYTHSWRLT